MKVRVLLVNEKVHRIKCNKQVSMSEATVEKSFESVKKTND